MWQLNEPMIMAARINNHYVAGVVDGEATITIRNFRKGYIDLLSQLNQRLAVAYNFSAGWSLTLACSSRSRLLIELSVCGC